MKNKEKKGTSHVEIIISFAIFISFMIFIFIMFKPLRIFSKTPSLDATEKEIIEKISTELIITSLTLNSSFSPTGNCLYADFSLTGGIIIKTDSGTTKASNDENSGRIYFEHDGRFYKIYSGEFEERTPDTGACQKLEGEDYTIGVIRDYKKVSESRLNDFFKNYTDNYGQLKQELGLEKDFNAAVMNNSRTIINNLQAERNKPENVGVTARDIPIEIINKDADIIPAIINLQVW